MAFRNRPIFKGGICLHFQRIYSMTFIVKLRY